MSQTCLSRSCHGCCASLDRRRFLQSCGVGAAVVAAESLWPHAKVLAQAQNADPVRVAAVFLCSMNTNEIWPYPGFDTQGRQQEILAALRAGCPEIEFQPVTVTNPADVSGATAAEGSGARLPGLCHDARLGPVPIGGGDRSIAQAHAGGGRVSGWLWRVLDCLQWSAGPECVGGRGVDNSPGRRGPGGGRVSRTPQSGRDG